MKLLQTYLTTKRLGLTFMSRLVSFVILSIFKISILPYITVFGKWSYSLAPPCNHCKLHLWVVFNCYWHLGDAILSNLVKFNFRTFLSSTYKCRIHCIHIVSLQSGRKPLNVRLWYSLMSWNLLIEESNVCWSRFFNC